MHYYDLPCMRAGKSTFNDTMVLAHLLRGSTACTYDAGYTTITHNEEDSMNDIQIRRGDILTYRNMHPEGKPGQETVSSYYDGVYLAIDDKVGDFVPAIRYTDRIGDYYSASTERRTIDLTKAVVENHGRDGDRVKRMIDALRRFSETPPNPVSGKRGYVESVYTGAAHLADELELLFGDMDDEPDTPEDARLDELATGLVVGVEVFSDDAPAIQEISAEQAIGLFYLLLKDCGMSPQEAVAAIEVLDEALG